MMLAAPVKVVSCPLPSTLHSIGRGWTRPTKGNIARNIVARGFPDKRLESTSPDEKLPLEVCQHQQQSNQLWLQACLSQPLRSNDIQCMVYVLGVCLWAPLQHELVEEALQQVQPDEVLLEQPPPTSSDLLLPYPEWIQIAMDHEQHLHQAGDPYNQQQHLLPGFKAELASSGLPDAKVGKDILDPFETFGYYAGLDFVRTPESAVDVLQMCGFFPGHEFVTAATHALTQGGRVRCIDAPIRLQESWVRGLVASFSSRLDEQAINSATPLKDFGLNQQLASTLPQPVTDWDQQLAAAATHLQQQQQQLQDTTAAAADQVGVSSGADEAAKQEALLLLFKVSKATAAACLPPDEAQQAQVLARMARLQPLKWRHFALRQQHMAQQIKEAASMAAQQAQDSRGSSASGSSSSSSSSRVPTLLVVVGRQHVAALRALWCDPSSPLWRSNVPRGFAPSMVEPPAAGDDAPAGGSTSTGVDVAPPV